MFHSNQKYEDEEIPFLDHVKELRKRIFITLLCFVLFFSVSYFTAPYVLSYLKSSAQTYSISLNIFKVTESVSIFIKIMFFQALCATIPIFITQMYLFVRPGLNKEIRKKTICIIPIVSGLFIVGAYIGFEAFVPLLLSFFLGTTDTLGINTVYSFGDFFTFVFTICFLFGFILEIPAFLSFLTIISVVTPSMLKKMRRIVYPLFSLIAVVVTPPDFVSDLIVMIVLFLLYEISIFLCHLLTIKTQKRNEVLLNLEGR